MRQNQITMVSCNGFIGTVTKKSRDKQSITMALVWVSTAWNLKKIREIDFTYNKKSYFSNMME